MKRIALTIVVACMPLLLYWVSGQEFERSPAMAGYVAVSMWLVVFVYVLSEINHD